MNKIVGTSDMVKIRVYENVIVFLFFADFFRNNSYF